MILNLVDLFSALPDLFSVWLHTAMYYSSNEHVPKQDHNQIKSENQGLYVNLLLISIDIPEYVNVRPTASTLKSAPISVMYRGVFLLN